MDQARNRRGEKAALAAVITGALALFPAALVLGAAALATLPRGNSHRPVAGAGVLLGVLGCAVAFLLGSFLWLHDPLPARQRAAARQLADLRAAQETFRDRALVDADGDGAGEYGLLFELAGATAGRPGAKPLISRVFARPTARGYVEKYGYYFIVYLPATSWADAVVETPDRRLRDPALADAREKTWIAYAWPAVAGKTAEGVFAAVPGGVFRAGNEQARFDGVANRPAPADALDGVGLEARVPLDGRPSRCGEVWERVGGRGIGGE